MRKAELQRRLATMELEHARAQRQPEVDAAALAVAMLLENHAETLAVNEGADIARYETLIRRARSIQNQIVAEPATLIIAGELYEELFR